MSAHPAAVVFDCDGTLVDSEPLSRQAWEAVLAQHGGEFADEDFAAVVGRGFATVRDHFHARTPLPPADELWVPYSNVLFALIDDELRAFEDALETLRDLRVAGVPVAVASSSARERLSRSLRVAGLEGWFEASVAGDEVRHGKPAPDLFMAAAERLGVAPGRCVAVEDTAVGVESARAAGMRVVAVCRAPEHQAGLEGAGADAIVERLSAEAVLAPVAPASPAADGPSGAPASPAPDGRL